MSALSGVSIPVPRVARPRTRLARLSTRITIGLWIPVVLAMCAYLLGGHLLTLPSPTRDSAQLARVVATVREGGVAPRWIALHVLDDECRCSARVLERLLARKADPTMIERVVLVETSAHEGATSPHSARVEAAGFGFDRISPEELASRYGIQAAPLLVVSDGNGVVRYVGGYTDRKQSPVIRDLDIVRTLRTGADVLPLPVFGCPVSKALDDAVDPFGLRR